MSDERRDEEADTKPLDARDWEENRGADEQEERPADERSSAPTVERAAPTQESETPAEDGEAPAEERAASTGEMTHERGSQAEADEYQWHTGRTREHGSEDAVEFIDVVKAFGRNRVLNGLNLGLPDNQISMILGPSGTGKSVCIKHMVGLLYPDEGDVLVHGESVPDMADEELFEMRKKFGVLFQDGALFGSMNVFDNTAFPLRQHTDKGEDEIREIVDRRLGEVGLAAAAEKMPNELSGGMRKRAGFARALVLDPDIVLFDEPDSGPRPGAHRAPVRADHGGARGERRRLLRDHARHHVGAARGRLHRNSLEGQDRRVWSGERALQLRQPVRETVFVRGGAGPTRHGVGPQGGSRRAPSALWEASVG